MILPPATGAPRAPAPDPSGEASASPLGAARPSPRTGLLVLVAVILLGWALKALSVVVMPLAAAILIALGVMPVRDWIRARMPRGLRWLGVAGALGVVILAGLVLVFFLTLLILLESGAWAQKLLQAMGARTEWQLLESSQVVAQKFRAYVTLQTAFGLVTGCLYAVWLWFWQVDLIIVWSLLTFLMNFIPNVGSVIAGGTTTAYALVTKDFGTAAAVGAGILTIEQVMGNVVAPQLQGKNIALSPLVVLVALVFWGWAWGVAGALLAVPVTFAIVVLMAHVPALRPWALLLTDQTDMAGLDESTRP